MTLSFIFAVCLAFGGGLVLGAGLMCVLSAIRASDEALYNQPIGLDEMAPVIPWEPRAKREEGGKPKGRGDGVGIAEKEVLSRKEAR